MYHNIAITAVGVYVSAMRSASKLESEVGWLIDYVSSTTLGTTRNKRSKDAYAMINMGISFNIKVAPDTIKMFLFPVIKSYNPPPA